MINIIFKSKDRQKMCRIQEKLCNAVSGSPAYMGVEICIPPEDVVTSYNREKDLQEGWHFQELLVGNSNSYDIEIELPDCETIDWESKIKDIITSSQSR